MAKFQRHFESVGKLQEEILFKNKLKSDCEKGDVFPAVRGGYMSFYYAGGSLFKIDAKVFFTHIKYAFVPKGETKDYVTQEELAEATKEDNFENGYEGIKSRCGRV